MSDIMSQRFANPVDLNQPDESAPPRALNAEIRALKAAVAANAGGTPLTIAGDKAPYGVLTATITPGWQNTGGIWRDTVAGVDIAGATSLVYQKTSEDSGRALTYKSSNLPYVPLSISIEPAANIIMFANRVGTASKILSNGGALLSGNQRIRIWNRSKVPVNEIVFRFANKVANASDLDNGTVGVTIDAGLAYPDAGTNPARVPITWDAGGTTAKLLAGGDVVDTYRLVLPNPILPGATSSLFWHPVFASAPAVWPSAGIPSTLATYDASEWSTGATASKAVTGSITGRDVAAHVMLPIAVFGRPVSTTPPGPIILIEGDSVLYGASDSTTGTGATGFATRGLFEFCPVSQAAQAGYALYAAFVATSPTINTPPSPDFLRKCEPFRAGAYTHVFMGLGGNDVKDGQTGLQAYTRLLAAKTYFDSLGVKLIVCTGMPRTNTTNNGPNSADDPGAMAQYIDYTNRIRAGNGVGHGFFDRMAVVCAPGDETRWNSTLHTPGQSIPGGDGVHPIALGHTWLATALAAQAPTLFQV